MSTAHAISRKISHPNPTPPNSVRHRINASVYDREKTKRKSDALPAESSPLVASVLASNPYESRQSRPAAIHARFRARVGEDVPADVLELAAVLGGVLLV